MGGMVGRSQHRGAAIEAALEALLWAPGDTEPTDEREDVMKVGSIVFGPKPTKETSGPGSYSLQGSTVNGDPLAQACNCIGPQPGQSKCPCALRRESEMGEKMIAEGVTVNGKRYRLVPED